ncbi:MAG TPA: hypothetical protein PKI68_06625 [Pontiellaceae bacterium]|nr:hypothetical protein [Pontiellaceae bacterium]
MNCNRLSACRPRTPPSTPATSAAKPRRTSDGMSSVDAVRTRLLRLKIFPDRVKILATRNTKRHEKVERDLRARLPARQKKTRSAIAFHPMIPFADDVQYFIKAGWKPAVRIAGFQPALSLD